MNLLPAFLTTGRAACTQSDPELFHSTHPADETTARAICAGCPLRTACADHALTTGERWGTWGGLTADDRQRLRQPGTWLDTTGRVRRPCGSTAALSAHHAYGETCDVCQAAHEARVLANRRRLLAAAHAAGGTDAGAQLHVRIGEPVCGPCGAARAATRSRYAAARQRNVQGLAVAA